MSKIQRIDFPFSLRASTPTSIPLNDLPIDSSVDPQSNYRLILSLEPMDTPNVWVFRSGLFDSDDKEYGTKAFAILKIKTSGGDVLFDQISIRGIRLKQVSSLSDLNSYTFLDTSLGTEQRINSIVNAINTNPELSWRYTAQSWSNPSAPTNRYILITANEPGSQYSFNWVTADNNTTEESFVRINNLPSFLTPDPVTPPLGDFNLDFQGDVSGPYELLGSDGNRGQRLQNFNYKMFLEIYEFENQEWNKDGSLLGFYTNNSVNSSGVKLKGVLKQNWTKENRFIFDISPYLNDIELEIPKQIFTESENTPLIYQVKKETQNGTVYPIKSYYLKWGEEYIGNVDTSTPDYFPTDDVWNVRETTVNRFYVGESEIRWGSRGVYNYNQQENHHPRYWVKRALEGTGNKTYFPLPAIIFRRKLKRKVDGPELLWFYIYKNPANFTTPAYNTFRLRIRTVFFHADGSTTTNYTHVTNYDNVGYDLEPFRNGLYCCDVSLNKIDFYTRDVATNPVLKYEITLQAFSGINYSNYTEPITYYVDLNTERLNREPEYSPSQEYYGFFNKTFGDFRRYKKIYWRGELGTIESFEFEGVSEKTLETEEVSYEQGLTLWNQGGSLYTDKLPNGVRVPQGEYNNRGIPVGKIFNKKKTVVNKLFSGWLEEWEIRQLESLISSNECYILKKEFFTTDLEKGISFGLSAKNLTDVYLEPIKIISNDFKIDNQNELYSLTIEVVSSIPENTLKN